jgi:hypothetical protein
MYCQLVICLDIFIHILQVHFSADLPHRFKVIDSWKQYFQVSSYTHTQSLPNPTLFEPYDCNKATTDSDTLSIFFCNFLQLKSWLCVGVL